MTATASALTLAEVAALADVPVERVRRYAEDGILEPATRSATGWGYRDSDVDLVRFAAGAEGLGITGGDLRQLTGLRGPECGPVRDRLAELVAGQLTAAEAEFRASMAAAAAEPPGSDAWARITMGNARLAERTARLQAAGQELTQAPHAGPCRDGCPCGSALNATPGLLRLTDSADGEALACDIAADAGDAANRVGVWQDVIGKVTGRAAIAGGIALQFPLDGGLAATVAGLAAAEYRCCSFGSYTVVVDERGLRLEVRMPDQAAPHLASIFGAPPTPEGELIS